MLFWENIGKRKKKEGENVTDKKKRRDEGKLRLEGYNK
jgi:hypothetical protein